MRGGNWEYSTRFKGKCHFHCLIHRVLLKPPLVKIGKKSKNSNCSPIPTFNLQFHHEVGLVQQNYFEFFLGMVYISSYKRSALKETDFNISGSFGARQEDLKIFFTTPHFQPYLSECNYSNIYFTTPHLCTLPRLVFVDLRQKGGEGSQNNIQTRLRAKTGTIFAVLCKYRQRQNPSFVLHD